MRDSEHPIDAEYQEFRQRVADGDVVGPFFDVTPAEVDELMAEIRVAEAEDEPLTEIESLRLETVRESLLREVQLAAGRRALIRRVAVAACVLFCVGAVWWANQPTQSDMHARAEELSRVGRDDEAIALHQKALASLVSDAHTFSLKAIDDQDYLCRFEPSGRVDEKRLARVVELVDKLYTRVSTAQEVMPPSDRRAASRIFNYMAWILATATDEADDTKIWSKKYARKALELAQPDDVFNILDTLAAVHALEGDFENAVKTQEEAVRNSPSEVRGVLLYRLALYRAGRRFQKHENEPIWACDALAMCAVGATYRQS
jgi:hypothetical protein